MTFVNMGSQSAPEGLPHWSNKALLWHKLDKALNTPSLYEYGTLLPKAIRNVSVPEAMPQYAREAVEKVQDRVVPRPGYAFVAYEEPPHGDCPGGFVLHNVLEGMIGGRVKLETPFAGYRPDVGVYAENVEKPAAIFEVVDTSSLSDAKIRAMTREGVEIYVYMANDKPMSIYWEPLLVQALNVRRCGRGLRVQIDAVFREIESYGLRSFVGIRTFPSGTQEYVYGEYNPEVSDLSWSFGDPQLLAHTSPFALGRPVYWRTPVQVQPVSEKRISRQLFMAYLIWMRLQLTLWWFKDNTLGPQVKYALSHIDQLLYMVRHPKK